MNVDLMRKRGIDDINNAIECDNSGRYKEAFNHYVKGIGDLLMSVKYTKNRSLRHTVLVKIVSYIDRSEELKVKLESSKTVKNTPPKQNKIAAADPEDGDAKIKASITSTLVKRGDTGVVWDDVVGLKSTKDALFEAVVLPKKFPSMFTGKRQPWSAILMYGPPGTGKSFLARAVATESGSTFFSISSSDIMSKWQGESEKTIKVLFTIAREEAPSVIFIDEIDSIAGARTDGEQDSTRRIKTQLMMEMQGMGTSADDKILVLAATNTPWSLDTAFRRRFQKRVHVGLPTKDARRIMFKKGLGDSVGDDFDLDKLAELSDGYSGSDIANVVRESLMVPIRKCMEAKQFKLVPGTMKFAPVLDYPNCSKCPLDLVETPSRGQVCEFCGVHCKIMDDLDDDTLFVPRITPEDVTAAIKSMPKSVADSELGRYTRWTKEYGQEG